MCHATERTALDLAVDPRSSGVARKFVSAAACTAHCPRPLIDDAILLTSEAVTNAVTHGGPPVVLAVECSGSTLAVMVRDGGPAVPTPRVATANDEGGRGLMLIAAVASSWGIDQTTGGGKTVWFELTV